MNSGNDLYVGVQAEVRTIDCEESPLVCSLVIQTIHASDPAEAYDELTSFGEKADDIDWRFGDKCMYAYLGLVNIFHIGKIENDFTLAYLPPVVLSVDKLNLCKKASSRGCRYLTKPLLHIERKRLSSKSGFFKPMFSYCNQSHKCWFAAVCIIGCQATSPDFFEMQYRIDCVCSPNPEAAFYKFKSRLDAEANKMSSLSGKKSLFRGTWEIWPLYDSFDDYGEIMELAHFLASEHDVKIIKDKHIMKKENLTADYVIQKTRMIAFNPVFLQWKGMFGI